jgi:hypothetical protein
MVDTNTIYSIVIPVGAAVITGLTILISSVVSSQPKDYYIGDYKVPQGDGFDVVPYNDNSSNLLMGGRRRKIRGRKTKKRR